MNLKTLKEEAYEANMGLLKYGLVFHTFGNASAFDKGKGVFAIKPSGVAYNKLKPQKMVVVDLKNKIVEGCLNPSSDTRTHSRLYLYFKDIGGISHTHSTFATAWAQSMKSIPVLGTTHADYMNTSIPCTKPLSIKAIRGDYETETGDQIAGHFIKNSLNYKYVTMVLVACHGPFTWGKSAKEAVLNSAVLENLSKMAYATLDINPKIKSLKSVLINRHFLRKHGKSSYYGQKETK